MKTVFSALIGALAFVATAAAQPTASTPAPPAADIAVMQNASWLAGRWVGEGLGGEIEENWSLPAGAQMVGHFRLVRNGAVVFYEISLLDVVNGGVRMRVKHFNPDFVGWEEKDGWHAFDPVSSSADTLAFAGLTLRRIDANTLETVIRIRYQDGERDETLRLHRAPL